MNDEKNTVIAIGSRLGALGVVRRVVHSLINSIEELPDFADLEPDDPMVHIVKKLHDVLDICKAVREGEDLAP